MTGDAAAAAPRGCAEALVSAYDVALLDLDGVVYIGKSAVAGAADALAKAKAAGLRVAFVTNNASRTPSAIAAQLTGLGVPTTASDVVTSAQAGARLLAERLPPAAAVLVVGGIGLRVAVRERGFRPVSVASERPAAVIQGYAPDLGYALLAEGALAVQAGALFVVSNADKTLPSARGRQPGNGSLSRPARSRWSRASPNPRSTPSRWRVPAPAARSWSATASTPTSRARSGSAPTACSCSPA
jgi:ribonucleotide monophosphatase NagD (HAD superfamily)